MDTLLNKIVKEHNRLLSQGKEPDSLYLNLNTRKSLAEQAVAAFHIQRETALAELLGMVIYTSEQYRDNRFRIYCKPQDLGEF